MTGDPRSAPGRPRPGWRLLVVDDDQIIRAALSMGLALHGYDVTAVGNGLNALEAIARMVPDLIVLDLTMPGMSGQRFVELLTLNGLRSRLRIVVVSADPDGEDEARATGADGYLRKPLGFASLVREIERLLVPGA
jgi:CheY-like chemotaxis protein